MDVITICNMAVGWLGGNSIMSLEDGTTESELCRTYYKPSRDSVLESVDWTFARKRAYLTPLGGEDGEVVGADYSNRFKIPPDCRVIRVLSMDGSFRDWQHLRYELEGRDIYASYSHLYLKYTSRCEEVPLFSAKFVHLVASQLAADICNTLTGSSTMEIALREKVTQLTDQAGGADGVQTLPVKQAKGSLISRRFSHG